jgi:[acyl-carrier-protein] S-malonyltransferase
MTPSFACVFPGQGSQKVGMLAAAGAERAVVRRTFDEASGVLGYDLWELAQTGPQDRQNLTECTQPLILSASVALWRAWLEAGGARPSVMAGHSLGEFSALVCAEAIGFADAVALVRNRGQYMQQAVPVGEGAMAAVLGLEDGLVMEACAEAAADQVVQAVNLNAPGQVVIAGHAAAVERAIAACKARGAKRAMALPVSAPFHTSLMQPAGERLAADLSGIRIRTPSIPVVHNVHARAESDPEQIRALLVRQIHSPVLWVDCVRSMCATGVDRIAEIGPGKVLSGLCKRIESGLQCLSTEEPADFSATLAAVPA